MSLLMWPWEQGIKPYFTNPEGFEWYKDDSVQKYIKLKELNNVFAFIVRKEDIIDRVLINDKQELLYSNQSFEAIGVFVDILKFQQDSNAERTNT